MSNSLKEKHLITLPIDEDLLCLRCMSPKKLRFEVEYSLGKGTTSNSFLFIESNQSSTSTILVNPPGENFAKIFLNELRNHLHAKMIW